MKIGIDLDNTILKYDDVFHHLAVQEGWVSSECLKHKPSIKHELIKRSGTEFDADQNWQQLQAWAYGPHIFKARLFNGFLNCIQALRRQNITIFIVSHKTRVSNFDPTINFHEAATAMLEKLNFFNHSSTGLSFNKEDVFFESSLDEKIERINTLNLTHFIDDLTKVLDHPLFPDSIQKIHFCPDPTTTPIKKGLTCREWSDIKTILLTQDLLHQRTQKKLPSKLKLLNSGNNRVYKTCFSKSPNLVFKQYLPDTEGNSNANREFKHIQILWGHHFNHVPMPIERNDNTTVYSCIDGTSPDQIKLSHIEKLSQLLKKLDRLSLDLINHPDIANGIDCRMCYQDYLRVIEKRWTRLLRHRNSTLWSKKLVSLFDDQLTTLKNYITDQFLRDCSSNQIDIERPFKKQSLIFSPSDFGFHNTLFDKNGLCHLVDLEYSGWDDPAKLLADFFHHAGQQVAWPLKKHLLDKFAQQRREKDANFKTRFNIVIDMIGFEWLLIILNVLDPEIMRRKQHANPNLDVTALIEERRKRACARIDNMMINKNRGRQVLSLPEVA